ncbi:hypothetical protein BC938DRAFT_471108 [Jimgerdemannia flammicorona]|uniref:Rho GTPase activation protein n=1 Tax=Jimgerdemannia flammicorona TaxID=994334 RepID=A0A433Q8T1_9FUNG|nr:hypothetical protein BC938DRAFT_471108 [Jimgerdemannia flammicorona]
MATATMEEWVEITDPQSGNQFFANPVSGECSWERPLNAIIKPKDPSGEWWELWDENHKLPYYYHTASGQTEWLKPEFGTVIPLVKIQSSAIGKRMSTALLDSTSEAFSAYQRRSRLSMAVTAGLLEAAEDEPVSLPRTSRPVTPTSPTAPTTPNSGRKITPPVRKQSLRKPQRSLSDPSIDTSQYTASRGSLESAYTQLNRQPSSGGLTRQHSSGGLNRQPSSGGLNRQPSSGGLNRQPSSGGVRRQPSRHSLQKQPSRTSLHSTSGTSVNNGSNGSSDIDTMVPVPKLPASMHPARKSSLMVDQAKKFGIGAPVVNIEAANAMNPMNQPRSPMLRSADSSGTNLFHSNLLSSQPTHRRPYLPSELQLDITQFAIDGFARQYFSKHKKGIFRKRVPVEEMLCWSKESIKQPLIVLNKDLHKDALRCYKHIQRVMGDKPRQKGNSINEDIQWLLDRGIVQGQLRDEIYVQVCKQLNGNPSGWMEPNGVFKAPVELTNVMVAFIHTRESIFHGWELLCVITVTFPPSKNLEQYLEEFVKQHRNIRENRIDIMSKHVFHQLARICVRGAKGKVLSIAEIERAKEAAFKPSVFGEPLEFIMALQQESYLALKIPRIVPFLADAVLTLNGQRSEGIFRVPGDVDEVTDLMNAMCRLVHSQRIRIENDQYDIKGITDPNVPASLLKFWLRDLTDPLIAPEFYEDCIKSAEDVEAAIAIVNKLPEVNRRVALYIIAFLQIFTDPESTAATRMNVHNLAMVFAPNFLRCPHENLTVVFENSKYEQAFVRTLIDNTAVDRYQVTEGNVVRGVPRPAPASEGGKM